MGSFSVFVNVKGVKPYDSTTSTTQFVVAIRLLRRGLPLRRRLSRTGEEDRVLGNIFFNSKVS
jgi:hypothetical protein